MNAVEKYINSVLRNIQASTAEKLRIEADLRAHLEEALANSEQVETVLARMGDPTELAVEFMSQVTLCYAGFWRRLFAFVIDLLILIPTVGILGIPIMLLSNLVPQHPADFEYILGAVILFLITGLALGIIGLMLLYFPLLEGRFGQTVGKRLLGLRVLKENGLPIGYKEAFLRRLSYYFEFLAFDALFIPFTAKRQRAFDIVAQTIVVQENKYLFEN